MRTIRSCRLTLAILLVFTLPATAEAVVYGVSVEVESGRNNRHDNSPRACDPDIGCFTNTGARCADAPGERCDLQVVPAGRCTQGTGSCVWPQGGGTCRHDGGEIPVDPVYCLSDAYLDFLRNGGSHPGNLDGPSVMGADVRGGDGVCDMSSSDPSCDCTGTDPNADPSNTDDTVPSWEGAVCGPGSIQAVCSDGDPKRGIGLGTSLCMQLCLEPTCDPEASCGSAHTFEGAVVAGLKYPLRESPAGVFTLQRQPGRGATTPHDGGRIRHVRGSFAIQADDAGTGDFRAWGLRRVRPVSNSYHFGAGFNASEVSGTIDSPTAYFMCDVPLGQGWSPERPVAGSCALAPEFSCIEDADCAALGPCDPETLRYCHQSDDDPHTVLGEPGFDTSGFLFTRSLTADEIAGAGDQCPPACRTAYDFHTFEAEALAQAMMSGDYRAGVQLVLNHLEGPQAGRGSHLITLRWVQSLNLTLGDTRCFIGGDPERADPTDDRIGRCASGSNACDPRAAVGSNGCAGGDVCRYCHGTADSEPDPTNGLGAYYDPVHGNAEALPVGYNTHGIEGLDLHGRIGVLNGASSNLEIPLLLVLTSGAAASEFRDNSCDEAGSTDKCGLGAVEGGATGIGPTYTYVNEGDPVLHEPDAAAPGYLVSLTIPPEDPGEPQGELLRPADWGVGPDGIPACFGDNNTGAGGGGSDEATCTEPLGDANRFGSPGTDDVLIPYDFSSAQDGSDLRHATRTRPGPVYEVFALTPVLNHAAALSLRDQAGIGNTDGLDLVGKIDQTLCPLLGVVGETREIVSTCLDSDLDQDGWLDEQDGCPLNPVFATGPDSGGVASASDPGGFLPDGILDACQCGDVNDDGRVSGNDATAITRACLRLPPYESTVLDGDGCQQTQTEPTPFVVEKCDVGGPFEDGDCSGSDASIVKRSTLDLPPGIDLTCTAYLP